MNCNVGIVEELAKAFRDNKSFLLWPSCHSSRSLSLHLDLMSTYRSSYSTYSMFHAMPTFPQQENNVNKYVILHSRNTLNLNDFLEHLLIMT